MRVAKIVDHDVKCGEEGVHVEHEESVPFPSGSVSKPTLRCGHLPLKSSPCNSHQAFKKEIIRRHLWEAGFSLWISRKSAARGEAFYVSGCLFRGVACMVQVLFALNERYIINEKGSVQAVDSFVIKPEGFVETVSGLLGYPGQETDTLLQSLSRYEALLDEVHELCNRTSPLP